MIKALIGQKFKVIKELVIVLKSSDVFRIKFNDL